MIIHLPIIDPSLVVLRKHVGHRAYLELLAVLPPLLLHIPPQVGFAAEAPGSRKMINLLIRIQASQLARPNQGRPNNIQALGSLPAIHQMEACGLEGIDDAVVGVRLAADSEGKVRVRHQLVLRQYLYLVRFEGSLHFEERRVVEED